MIDRQVEVLELARQKFSEFIDGAVTLITADEVAQDRYSASLDDQPGVARWALGDETLDVTWQKVGEEEGETYRWPDGNLDEYVRFATYRGLDKGSLFTLALGYLENGDVVGFVLGVGGGSKRGITYFFPTDDSAETKEKVSMIRGGGDSGRGGFAPGAVLPKGYANLKTDVLADRVAGKWNVQAVVAHESDDETMLTHTALQARLRGIA